MIPRLAFLGLLTLGTASSGCASSEHREPSLHASTCGALESATADLSGHPNGTPDPSAVGCNRGRDYVFVPERGELHGIRKVRLQLDGLPNPVRGTDDEKSLAKTVSAQLRRSGLNIADSYDLDELELPILHVRVLVVTQDQSLFYSISVELKERCRPARNPDLIALCSTWSSYPRVGFLPEKPGDHLQQQVIEGTRRFIEAWKLHNPRAGASGANDTSDGAPSSH